MRFQAKHYQDKLHVINPLGFIGVVCLWSKQDFVIKKLTDFGVDLSPNASKIATIGNLYGNGLSELLCNLLYNPQITHLIICGSNLSGSREDLITVFKDGIEMSEDMGKRVKKVKNRNRIINNAISLDLFKTVPFVEAFGDITNQEECQKLSDYIAGVSSDVVFREEDRLLVELEKYKAEIFPCEPRSITIVRDNPLAAWKELIFDLKRFGHVVKLRKGDRKELQNVKVIIKDFNVSDQELEYYGFQRSDIDNYMVSLLSGDLAEDQDYTYGNRIRAYYGIDFLKKVCDKLNAYPNDRDCYCALWDSHLDMDAKDAPCMVSLFFRVFDGELTLTATFRTHNALDAWLKNVFGLRSLQEYVAEKTGLPLGPITVISHSISLDMCRYDLAQRVSDTKSFEINMDYNGQILINIDGNEIVVVHNDKNGNQLGQYRSQKPEKLQHMLYRDCVISDINHAIYVGRMLEQAYNAIKTGEPFNQT